MEKGLGEGFDLSSLLPPVSSCEIFWSYSFEMVEMIVWGRQGEKKIAGLCS